MQRLSQAERIMMTQMPEGERPRTKERRSLHEQIPEAALNPGLAKAREIGRLRVHSEFPLAPAERLVIRSRGRVVEVWRVGSELNENNAERRKYLVTIERY